MPTTPTSFISTAVSNAQDPATAADEIVEQLQREECNLDQSLILFFCGADFALDALSDQLRVKLPNSVFAGATTCGEIAEGKILERNTVAMALASPVRAAARLVPDLGAFRFDDGPTLLQNLATDLGVDLHHLQQNQDRYLLMTLTDGLTAMEEVLMASLLTSVPDMELVGGGAGDGFRFKVTRVAVGSKVARHAAAVILLEPNVPFHTFHLHHFHPTGQSFVVTEADPNRRFIQRIDGYPATEFLADLLGKTKDELLADSNSAAVFGVQSGDQMYLRTVMAAMPDKLLMGGGIEEGTVIHLMEPDHLVTRTEQGLKLELAQVRNPSAMLQFSCGGRYVNAVDCDCLEELGRTLCPIPTIGFSTYGEQIGSMQVNHTLTGLILGSPGD